MCLFDGIGYEVIELIVEEYFDILVVMIIVYGNVDVVVSVFKVGVFDFVFKLVDIQMLCWLVCIVLKLVEEKCGEVGGGVVVGFSEWLIGDLLVMQQVCVIIVKFVCNQVLVYIVGEFGVGKELVVWLIYE